MSGSLSLYDLSQELIALMNRWDDPDTPAEERGQLEAELRAFAQEHVRKVDSVRHYLIHCAIMMSAAAEEAQRLKERREMWKARAERLKEICVGVMQAFKATRFDGNTGALLVKANGGKQAVTIYNPDIVPEEFCVFEGSISYDAWQVVSPYWQSRDDVRLVRTPSKKLIEAELQQPCQACAGMGAMQCAIPPPATVACSVCGGSGKRGVPGCTLEPRGVHLEVK